MLLRLILITILAQINFSNTLIFAEEGGEKVVLLQGEQLSLPKKNSLWVENRNVIKADETDKAFILHGIKPGYSEVKIGTRSIQVNVLSLDQSRTEKLLNNILKKTLGLKLEIENGQVLVKGRLLRWDDWKKLSTACRDIHCDYLMNTQISEELTEEAESKINQHLSTHSLPRQKIDFSEYPQIHLPAKSDLIKNVEKVLAPYGIKIIHDSSSIELAPLVKVQITVVEVKKDFSRTYGLKWPASYRAQFLPSPVVGYDQAFADVQFWEASGNGRVLASPNILCRSGKEAEFLAGGEFPIKFINFKTQDVIWKKYGILLKVSPVADYSGRMSISIQTEVSSIDPAKTIDGIPGLFTNRVQSHFDLVKPRTIALSGLLKNEESQNSEGLAWLSNIPVLGPLFSSKNFRNNKTELVIFVRPEIVNPDQTNDEEKLAKELKYKSDE